MVIELRDYQQANWNAICERLFGQGERGAFSEMPTGSGKTLTTALLAKMVTEQDTGVLLVLAEMEKLLLQARDKILDFVPKADIGCYGFGKRALSHRIILGGVDTLARPEHLEK